ncbi:MAG: Fur family transcriptional regulator [Candidatus Paceibacterota bacterium]
MKKIKQEKEIGNILKNNGFKVTPSRVRILEILKEKHSPMTVEDICFLVQNETNKTTVYRALDDFSKKGIIYQTHFRDGKTYFEFQDHHHHHIVCTSCGVKEGISFCVGDIIKKIPKHSKRFTKINDHVLEFFGICQKCNNI